MTPSHFPELDMPAKYKRDYEELMADGSYNQTSALKVLGRRYNVPRTTLRYHLFSSDRERQRQQYWRRRERRPGRPQKVIDDQRRRNRVRRALDGIVERTLAEVTEPRDLRQLAYLVEAATGVAFQPRTFLTLNRRHQVQTGAPLLLEVPGFDPPRYVLRADSEAGDC